MHEANQPLPDESSSPEYYATSVLDLPYRVLLGGRKGKWSLYTRLVLILRKALGVRLPVTIGYSMPLTIPPSLSIESLPPLLQDRFRLEIHEAENLGFHLVKIARGTSTIGYHVSYGATLLSSDGRTLLSIGWFRIVRGSLSRSNWTLGANTYLNDKTLVLTGRTQATISEDLLSTRHKLEQLPPSTPLAEVFKRHTERLQTLSQSDIITLTRENAIDYQLSVLQDAFRERLKNRPHRKLTPAEVANLQKIHLKVV